MPQKGVPVYFDDLPDAAAFLSDRIGKVKSQNEAETIMRMLPALFSYQIPEPPQNKFSLRKSLLIRDGSSLVAYVVAKIWRRIFR